jgi:sucrose-6-phosphate hydrolase SacC (GH32 family)
VLWGASGEYWVGTFDGRGFRASTPRIRGDCGANAYAAQAFDDLPDHRVVLVTWMNGGKYPGMPFNQQMGLPVTLELRDTPQGPRLRKWPVRELEALEAATGRYKSGNSDVASISAALRNLDLELDDIRLDLPASRDWKIEVRGLPIEWNHAAGRLRVRGRDAVLTPSKDRVSLRMILDRTSLETFADDGLVVFSDCFLPAPNQRRLRISMTAPETAAGTCEIRPLRAAWRP